MKDLKKYITDQPGRILRYHYATTSKFTSLISSIVFYYLFGHIYKKMKCIIIWLVQKIKY